jgi:hypothetical protein
MLAAAFRLTKMPCHVRRRIPPDAAAMFRSPHSDLTIRAVFCLMLIFCECTPDAFFAAGVYEQKRFTV